MCRGRCSQPDAWNCGGFTSSGGHAWWEGGTRDTPGEEPGWGPGSHIQHRDPAGNARTGLSCVAVGQREGRLDGGGGAGMKMGWGIPVWGIQANTPPAPPRNCRDRMRGRWISLRKGDRIGPVRQLLPRFRDAFTKSSGEFPLISTFLRELLAALQNKKKSRKKN